MICGLGFIYQRYSTKF